MPDDDPDARPSFRFELLDPCAVLTGAHVGPLDGSRHLQVTGDLELRNVAFPVLLRLLIAAEFACATESA
ncbi:hypothetical protein [Streptomyces sp. NPDC087859]|uniref:hypothetical protein n=1 Tax=Streptomyces sp. NPDC087859 TaxID=3365812 RepID=UPI00380494E0